MKTAIDHKRQQRGTALIVVIAILSILLTYVMGNVLTLNNLGRDIQFVDQRQKARIHMPKAQITETNATPAAQ